jgi:hypothetical protein
MSDNKEEPEYERLVRTAAVNRGLSQDKIEQAVNFAKNNPNINPDILASRVETGDTKDLQTNTADKTKSAKQENK